MVEYNAPDAHHNHVDPNKENQPCPKDYSYNCERLVVDLEKTLPMENIQVEH
jgi:hypothetical protein